MSLPSPLRLLPLAALLLLGSGCAVFGPSSPVDRSDNPDQRTGFFTSPSEKSPGAQWALAELYEKENRLSRAARAYRNLMYEWPGDLLAARAQQRRAELHERMDRPAEAFKHYRFLLERYSDRVDGNDIVNRMIRIAQNEETRRRGGFLFIPGFTSPTEAVPLYSDIVRLAPRHPGAPGCLLRAAKIQHADYEYPEAIKLCNQLLASYPDAAEYPDALHQKMTSSVAFAADNPYDDQAAQSARAAAMLLLDTKPAPERAEEALGVARALYDRLARSQWEKAVYYDRKARNPEAALKSYQTLLQLYPVSEWTEAATTRIRELSPPPQPTDTTP